MLGTEPTPVLTEKAMWRRYGLLPNGITILRIIGCFVPAWMILHPQTYTWQFIVTFTMPWWLATIMLFALIAFTDRLDGIAARKTDSITAMGEKLDPIADKLLVIPTFIAICWSGLILTPWGWIVFALTAIPEVVLVAMNIYLSVRRVDARIPSIMPGKIKMWLQCGGLVLALIPVPEMWWQVVIIGCFTAGLCFSYVATVAYLRTGAAYLNAAQ